MNNFTSCAFALLLVGCATPQLARFGHDQVRQVTTGDSEAKVSEVMPQPTIKTNAMPRIDVWVWQNPAHVEPLLARVIFQDSKVLAVDEFSAAQAAALQVRTQIDRDLGREPALVRAIYLANHPDLDAVLQREVKAGLIPTSGAEQQRLSEIDRKRYDAAQAEHMRQARAEANQARKDYVSQHPEVSLEIREAILKQRLVIGMTADQVKLSYGEPRSVHSTTTAAGRTEMWTWNGRDTVATLTQGILTSFSD